MTDHEILRRAIEGGECRADGSTFRVLVAEVVRLCAARVALDAIRALEPDPVRLTRTDRGYLRGGFADLYGNACSIQESSLATEHALWLGVDGPGGRMHLSRAMAAALLPHLERFAATGELGEGTADA